MEPRPGAVIGMGRQYGSMEMEGTLGKRTPVSSSLSLCLPLPFSLPLCLSWNLFCYSVPVTYSWMDTCDIIWLLKHLSYSE